MQDDGLVMFLAGVGMLTLLSLAVIVVAAAATFLFGGGC